MKQVISGYLPPDKPWPEFSLQLIFMLIFSAQFLGNQQFHQMIHQFHSSFKAEYKKDGVIFASALPTWQCSLPFLCNSSSWGLSQGGFYPNFSTTQDLERFKFTVLETLLSATPTTTMSPTPMPPTTPTTRSRTTMGGTWCQSRTTTRFGTWCQATSRSWWERRATRPRATTTPTICLLWWDSYLSSSLLQL